MSRPTVLIVDDDAILRTMLVEVLTLEGYPVEAAAHGQEAIDIMEQQPTLRRIVLLDLMMPGVSGWGVVRWMIEHPEVKAQCTTILMSANEKLKQASDLEHDAELEKPFDIDRLMAVIAPLR